MTIERKRIKEKSEEVDLLQMLQGYSIEEVILFLQELNQSHAEDMLLYDKKVVFEGIPVDWYGAMEWQLVTYRWETDEELAKREAKSKKAKETRDRTKKPQVEDPDYELYKKLKRKYEDK